MYVQFISWELFSFLNKPTKSNTCFKIVYLLTNNLHCGHRILTVNGNIRNVSDPVFSKTMQIFQFEKALL